MQKSGVCTALLHMSDIYTSTDIQLISDQNVYQKNELIFDQNMCQKSDRPVLSVSVFYAVLAGGHAIRFFKGAHKMLRIIIPDQFADRGNAQGSLSKGTACLCHFDFLDDLYKSLPCTFFNKRAKMGGAEPKVFGCFAEGDGVVMDV